MKRCYRCRQEKPPEAFSVNRSRSDGKNSQCRTCQAELRKTHYEANKQQALDRVKARRVELRRRMWEYKAIHPCVDCGESNPIVLEFDHLGDKVLDVTKMVWRGISWKRIEAEIAKCDIVCANHHKIRTWERGGFYAGESLASETQLDVCQPSKLVAAGSSPVTRSG